MNQVKSQNEADLGRLLFGDRSPMSLHVCLKPDAGEGSAMASLDPFEVINLGVGRRYVLARLSVGKGFMTQFVLLNIYNPQSDATANSELRALEKYADDPRAPLPSVVSIGDKDGHNPTFYCGKTQVFFNVPCPTCSATLILKPQSDYLFCPRCEELDPTDNRYSYYEVEDTASNGDSSKDKVTLLEDVFSLYANTPNLTSSVPCSGCKHSSSCFPAENKTADAVVNERHFIIPFSLDSFSVYGFSYYPLSLIDYCELVSGKSKESLLQSLQTTGQTGRYRVLMESGSFAYQLNEHNYLTVDSPNAAWIISVKLRVLMRICHALKKLGGELDLTTITHNDMRMDVSQSYAAGDSFSRARLVFLCGGKENDQWGSDEEEIPAHLSDTLFFVFFKNKNNNELSLKIAIDILIDLVNSRCSLTLKELDEIISSASELKQVFVSGGLTYEPKTGLQPSLQAESGAACNQLVLMIVRLGLLLSKDINSESFELSIKTISQAMIELEQIFTIVDDEIEREMKAEIPVQDLLLTALNDIIEDKDWINSVFPNNQKTVANDPEIDLKTDRQSDQQEDKTIIMSEKADFDKTVLLKGKLPDNTEVDDVMIMSSINRILRQL